MQNLVEKYNISPTFYRRYFCYNAEMRYAIDLQNFLLFKKGEFLNPLKKNEYISKLIEQDIYDFYEQHKFKISKLDFYITTCCTLKCKDCSFLLPLMYKNKINECQSFDEFKLTLDTLLNSIDYIDMINLLGGEPLLNKELPKMIEYCANNKKIGVIKIITNATILFSNALLDVLKNNNDKVYVYISNYSTNDKITHLLKYDAIIKQLKIYNIKHQIMKDLYWTELNNVPKQNLSPEKLTKNFASCPFNTCLSVFNNGFFVCPRAAALNKLFLADEMEKIMICNNDHLKEDLIDFYHKPFYSYCDYCFDTKHKLLPAIQI